MDTRITHALLFSNMALITAMYLDVAEHGLVANLSGAILFFGAIALAVRELYQAWDQKRSSTRSTIQA